MNGLPINDLLVLLPSLTIATLGAELQYSYVPFYITKHGKVQSLVKRNHGNLTDNYVE